MRLSARTYAGVVLLGAILTLLVVLGGRVGRSSDGGSLLPPVPSVAPPSSGDLTASPSSEEDDTTSESKAAPQAGDAPLSASVPQDPSPAPPDDKTPVPGVAALEADPAAPGVNRIAYVGQDARIRSMDPDGSDEMQISPSEGIFTWPTWSPDATRIVYSGVLPDTGAGPRIGLFAYDSATGLAEELHAGESGFAGFLAEGVVHYSIWSPDGRHVAFIVVTPMGLTLFIDNLEDVVEAQYVLDQGPLWMSWSSDSRFLLVHRDADLFLVDTRAGLQAQRLDVRTSGYRVPAWQPHEHRVNIVAASRSSRFTLESASISPASIGESETVMDVAQDPAFLWSPDGRLLAVAGASRALLYRELALLVYESVVVLSEDDDRPPIEIEDNVIAYFWSPDGRRLAYVTLSETRGLLRWTVLDV